MMMDNDFSMLPCFINYSIFYTYSLNKILVIITLLIKVVVDKYISVNPCTMSCFFHFFLGANAKTVFCTKMHIGTPEVLMLHKFILMKIKAVKRLQI